MQSCRVRVSDKLDLVITYITFCISYVTDAICAYCKKMAKDLKRCASCEIVLYCNRECQTKHWHNGHKDECAGKITNIWYLLDLGGHR